MLRRVDRRSTPPSYVLLRVWCAVVGLQVLLTASGLLTLSYVKAASLIHGSA
jgi:hypothetical protein